MTDRDPFVRAMSNARVLHSLAERATAVGEGSWEPTGSRTECSKRPRHRIQAVCGRTPSRPLALLGFGRLHHPCHFDWLMCLPWLQISHQQRLQEHKEQRTRFLQELNKKASHVHPFYTIDPEVRLRTCRWRVEPYIARSCWERGIARHLQKVAVLMQGWFRRIWDTVAVLLVLTHPVASTFTP